MGFSLNAALAWAFGGAGAGLAVYQGELAAREQRRALAAQKVAEQEARNRALSQERKNAMAIKAANKKRPQVDALLADAASESRQGIASTMLTSFYGVDLSRSQLSRSSLLGE